MLVNCRMRLFGQQGKSMKRTRRLSEEEKWCAARRKQVRLYVDGQHLKHGRIGLWPAWHVQPYLSLWAIESAACPDWVGWWVICGDLPTDYVSALRIKHPRTALRAFAKRWEKVADCMHRGRKHPTVRIGERSEWPNLEPLLRARAKLLVKFADDGEIWKQ